MTHATTTALTIFLSLLATAGGLFCIGLALLVLRLIWAYVVGASLERRGR